jgi:hypothetical protein
MRIEDVKVGQTVRRIYEDGPGRAVGLVVSVDMRNDHVTLHYPTRDRWLSCANAIDLVEDVPVVVTHPLLPADAAARKEIPIGTGVLDYFSAALAEVAKVSFEGNKQHNPGQELHWARGKSNDQYDTMIRHSLERGTLDTDGVRHSAKMAWRALAVLQLELEADGAPMSRGSREPEEKK